MLVNVVVSFHEKYSGNKKCRSFFDFGFILLKIFIEILISNENSHFSGGIFLSQFLPMALRAPIVARWVCLQYNISVSPPLDKRHMLGSNLFIVHFLSRLLKISHTIRDVILRKNSVHRTIIDYWSNYLYFLARSGFFYPTRRTHSFLFKFETWSSNEIDKEKRNKINCP